MWSNRDLTIKGKITIVNSLVVPKIIYPASNIYTPPEVVKELKLIINKFVWNNGTPKVAHQVLTQKIKYGGLKLINIEKKIDALQLSWINRITTEDENIWKEILKIYLNENDLNRYFKENRNAILTPSKFYNNILQNWAKIKEINIPERNGILSENIWNNRYILQNKKPIWWKKLYERGIIKIQDLIDNEYNFKSIEQISEEFNCRINFFELAVIKECIPREWKKCLKENIIVTNTIKLVNKIRNLDFKTNELYWYMIEKVKITPMCIKKWEEEFPIMISCDSDLWERIFSRCFEITEETKLQSIQFKINHRIIPCQNKLYNWKIATSNTCLYCNDIDDIQHFVLKCPKVKTFWFGLLNWWNRCNIQLIDLYSEEMRENILFGFMIKEVEFDCLNYIILNAKHYIYKRRIHDSNNIFLLSFLAELRNKLEIIIGTIPRKHEKKINIFKDIIEKLS
jgi:hypothetical protein